MSKKESFITEVFALTQDSPETYFSPDALDFWNGLQMSEDKTKKTFTENGKKVLAYMQANKDSYNNLFKAKDVGEGMGSTSRTVSGALRKLTTDGYVEKVGENPVIYSLTALGVETKLEDEE